MDSIQSLGFAAAACTTFCFLPQVLKSARTKGVTDFSWGYLLLLSAGTFLWLAYGLLVRDGPIIAANAVSELLILSLIGLKLRYG